KSGDEVGVTNGHFGIPVSSRVPASVSRRRYPLTLRPVSRPRAPELSFLIDVAKGDFPPGADDLRERDHGGAPCQALAYELAIPRYFEAPHRCPCASSAAYPDP